MPEAVTGEEKGLDTKLTATKFDYTCDADISACSSICAVREEKDMEDKLWSFEDTCLLPIDIEKSSPKGCRKIDDFNSDDIMKEVIKAAEDRRLNGPIKDTLKTSKILQGRLKFGLLNCRSLGKGKANLLSMISEQKLDICALVETWIYVDSEIPEIPGFKMWFNLRESDKHGGIIVWVKDTMATVKVQTPKLSGGGRQPSNYGLDAKSTKTAL